MYTKYISLYYGTYLLYCLRYSSSVNCIRFPMKCCINGENIIRLLCLTAKLLKFEIQKCGQILCAHKPYFLMPGHICRLQSYNLEETFHCRIFSLLIISLSYSIFSEYTKLNLSQRVLELSPSYLHSPELIRGNFPLQKNFNYWLYHQVMKNSLNT